MNTSDGKNKTKQKKKNRNQNKISSISKHNKLDIYKLSHQDQDCIINDKTQQTFVLVKAC